MNIRAGKDEETKLKGDQNHMEASSPVQGRNIVVFEKNFQNF